MSKQRTRQYELSRDGKRLGYLQAKSPSVSARMAGVKWGDGVYDVLQTSGDRRGRAKKVRYRVQGRMVERADG